ncbi:MAG: hypothetical protein CML33_03350 [Rhodobacteraceae bacterium]|nr:hypothetical protein [Paracoccaceae bacterium]
MRIAFKAIQNLLLEPLCIWQQTDMLKIMVCLAMFIQRIRNLVIYSWLKDFGTSILKNCTLPGAGVFIRDRAEQ